jgi:predicted Zn finger-like uncharacterized protein
MRLTCPTCAAVYEVPDRLLAGGARRPVRCSLCGAVWVPPVPAPEGREAETGAVPTPPDVGAPAPPPEAPPASGPLRAPPPWPPPRDEPPLAAPEARGGGLALAAAWLVSLALVAGGLAALWIWRAEVSAFWPPAARLFALLGG